MDSGGRGLGASAEQGTQAYKVVQVSLRDPRAPEGILAVPEALCTPRVGSGLFPQESALQAGWLSLGHLPDSPDSYSLAPAAGLEASGRWAPGENVSLGHTWL